MATQELALTAPNDRPDSMLAMIERVIISPDFDVNKLQHLLELRERYEAAEAKKAYVAAKARFASLDVVVTKDKTNKQYDSKYTSIGNLVNTVRPHLASCGFEARWRIKQSADGKSITVTCVLTHEQGHFEEVSIDVPPDTSGAKNALQQVKSAITYARNLTFESVCGLASTDLTVNVDDDANGTGGGLPEVRYVELLDFIANASTHEELKRIFFTANDEAKAVKDQAAQRSFSDAKNKRYREIANAGR